VSVIGDTVGVEEALPAPPAEPPPAETRERRRVPKWLQWVVGLAVVGVALSVPSVYETILGRMPNRPDEALKDIVNVFTCCIFTWNALTTMLPAFLLGGAITAFVPAPVIMRHLGVGANKIVAYLVAAISGVVLATCSCNVIPLFASIYKRGAGIGPAFAFLYAGPAINIVALFFTMKVIGPIIGIWRGAGVPVIAIAVGLLMSLLFIREERRRVTEIRARSLALTHTGSGGARVWILFATLLGFIMWGSSEVGDALRFSGCGVIAALIATFAWWRFSGDELREWIRETWLLVKMVVPILLPALLVIGAASAFIDIKVVYRLVGSAPEGATMWRHLQPIAIGDLFGALMYFPILTEVAFTKAFLKNNMDLAGALAILLTGSGLSLPGLFILSKAVGWLKALVYEGLVVLLTFAFCAVFASEFGQYICECMMK